MCEALRRSDAIFSTHRCHAHYLAKGGDLQRMAVEIYGKAAGCYGGSGEELTIVASSYMTLQAQHAAEIL